MRRAESERCERVRYFSTREDKLNAYLQAAIKYSDLYIIQLPDFSTDSFIQSSDQI
jgi:hypothetical protein